jgi:hypothetical protein
MLDRMNIRIILFLFTTTTFLFACNARWVDRATNISYKFSIPVDETIAALRDAGFSISDDGWQRASYKYVIPSIGTPTTTGTKVTIYGCVSKISEKSSLLTIISYETYGAPVYRENTILPTMESVLAKISSCALTSH